MNIYELIKKRRSVRSYKNKSISDESLNKILEAGRLAPSAHNAQDYKFVVVKDEKRRKEVAEAAGQSFIGQAPIIIAAVSLKPEYLLSSDVPAYPIDLGIALDHITLAAVEEGLGTCWIGAFSQEGIKRVLGIPDRYKVVALLPIGFSDDKPEAKLRKNLNELVCFEQFLEKLEG